MAIPNLFSRHVLEPKNTKVASSKETRKTDSRSMVATSCTKFCHTYGESRNVLPPASVIKGLQPFTCEWLTRPEVAMSGLGDTIISSIHTIADQADNILTPEFVQKISKVFEPIGDDMGLLNSKDSARPHARVARRVIKHLAPSDEQDDLIDNIYKVGGAMFTLAPNLVITRNLLRHPKEFANRTETSDDSGPFKNKPNGKTMLEYLLKDFPAKGQIAENMALNNLYKHRMLLTHSF